MSTISSSHLKHSNSLNPQISIQYSNFPVFFYNTSSSIHLNQNQSNVHPLQLIDIY